MVIDAWQINKSTVTVRHIIFYLLGKERHRILDLIYLQDLKYKSYTLANVV
jgi:hypothetical protein